MKIILINFRRVNVGERTSVNLAEAKANCYVVVDKNNVAAVVVADEEYPEKIAFVIIGELFREFYKITN
jgi:synaptobrevin family protein YKT6